MQTVMHVVSAEPLAKGETAKQRLSVVATMELGTPGGAGNWKAGETPALPAVRPQGGL